MMRSYAFVFTLLLLSWAWQPSASSAAVIRGFVVDSTSAENLPMANILLKGTERGAATNADGYFVLDHLDPGLYQLQITYLGTPLERWKSKRWKTTPIPCASPFCRKLWRCKRWW